MSETSLRLTHTIYSKVIDEVINQLRTDKSFEKHLSHEAINYLEKVIDILNLEELTFITTRIGERNSKKLRCGYQITILIWVLPSE